MSATTTCTASSRRAARRARQRRLRQAESALTLPWASGLPYSGEVCQGVTSKGVRCRRWTRVEYAWPTVTLALCATHGPERWQG